MTGYAERFFTALPLSGRRVTLEPAAPPTPDECVLNVLTGDADQVGVMHLRWRDDTVDVAAFEITAARRGFGLGAEVSHLVADAARAAGARALCGWAPATHGLAVYFWFRVGFRFSHADPQADGLWFRRGLTAAAGSAP